MADQNPQVNQNINNPNDSDELFGGSDDIFENSDLLQPIDSEIATAHEVVKSQNDLNNFSGEVNSNQVSNGQSFGNIVDGQPVQPQITQQSEAIASDDLFEETKPVQKESSDNFDGLYDETSQENQSQNNDVPVNDDIFEQEPAVEEKFDEIPEIDDIAQVDEPQSNIQPEAERQPEVEQPEIVETPEIVENSSSENIQDNPDTQTEDDDIYDDIDDLNDIEDLDDIDVDDVDEVKDFKENNEEGIINDGNNEVIENVVQKNDEEDEDIERGFVQNNEKVEEENDDTTYVEEENDEDNQESSDDDIENSAIQDYEKYDPNLFKTDVQKKYGELQWKSEKIHELVGKDQDVGFDLLGGNDDRQKIIYKITSGSDYVEIEKEELNKADESTVTNVLAFELSEDIEQNMSLQLYVNDIELYDEIRDLQNDQNKKMQVLEKMNKFIFLLDEEYKKIQKYKKEKEERNAVKGVFRNF